MFHEIKLIFIMCVSKSLLKIGNRNCASLINHILREMKEGRKEEERDYDTHLILHENSKVFKNRGSERQEKSLLSPLLFNIIQ